VLEQPRAVACVVSRRSMFGGAPRASCSRTPDARRAAPRAAAYVVGSPLKAEVEPARKRERLRSAHQHDRGRIGTNGQLDERVRERILAEARGAPSARPLA
jgi:hypothetical protein